MCERTRALPLPGIADTAQRSIYPAATATCISISAELGAIGAERFIALFTAATPRTAPRDGPV